MRRHTAQCDQVVSDQLGEPAPRLALCDDYARAVATGGRAARDAPFVTRGCATVWFSPAEAC
jgi:hypothetical protein